MSLKVRRCDESARANGEWPESAGVSQLVANGGVRSVQDGDALAACTAGGVSALSRVWHECCGRKPLPSLFLVMAEE